MENFENELHIIVEEEIKNLLSEGLSSELYHFCPLNSMFMIAKENQFRLTSIEDRPSDKRLTSNPINKDERKVWNYYMCFSRTKSSLSGYVGMRRDKTGGATWGSSLVRITLDGALLGSRYKGMPVNYFNDKNLPKIKHNHEFATQSMLADKQKENPKDYYVSRGKIYSKDKSVKDKNGNVYSTQTIVNKITPRGVKKNIMKRYTPHMPDKTDPRGKPRSGVYVDYGVLDRNQMHEYEDRLFSNKPVIENALKYIKRIDIYLSDNILNGSASKSHEALFMVDKILDLCGNKVHIYNNMSGFELGSDRYDISSRLKELNKSSYARTHENIGEENLPILTPDIRCITCFLVALGFKGFYNGWEKDVFQYSKTMLEKIGFPEAYNEDMVHHYIRTYIRRVNEDKWTFFLSLGKYFGKELQQMASVKYKKFIKPLEAIKSQQEEWLNQTYNTNNKFETLKANMAKNSLATLQQDIKEEIEKTQHFRNERGDRSEAIEEIGGYGKSVCKRIVDRGHPDGPEIFVLTDNAIIKVYNANTLRHVTDLIARPEQIIDRLGSALATLDRDLMTRIFNLARMHHERGYNYR